MTTIAVLHFGNDASASGSGISSVISGHLSRSDAEVRAEAIPTYSPAAPTFAARNRSVLHAYRVALRASPRRTVLHVHLSNRGSFVREGLVVLLAAARRVPTVVTLHGSSVLSSGAVVRRALPLIARLATTVHVLSQEHAAAFRALTGRDCVVIPNAVPVPPDVLAMADRSPHVVFGGEIGRRKGSDVLLDAWGLVRPDGWTLTLYGPVAGDFSAELSDRLDRAHGVAMGGEVSRGRLQEALRMSPVAVLPSRAEALPMFLLEAMAAGCAVIGSDAGAIPATLGGGAGEVVAAGDVDALAAALRVLLGDGAVRQRLGAAARARMRDLYDEPTVAARWRDLYTRLAAS